MGVIVRAATAAAGSVLGRAKRIGIKSLLGTDQYQVVNQVIDGFLIRSVRNGQNVLVTIIDIPTLFAACGSYNWVGPYFSGEVHYVAFPAPGDRARFYQQTLTLDASLPVDPKPHKFAARVSFGATPAGTQSAQHTRGLFSHSPDGVVCVRLNYRGSTPVITVDRATANMIWLADTVTPAEITALGTADKRPTLNRVGAVEFPESSMFEVLDGRSFVPGYSGHNNHGHCCELAVTDAVVATNSFKNSDGGTAGIAMWRYTLVPPPPESLPATKPTVAVPWAWQLDVTALAEALLVPQDLGATMQSHAIRQTVVSASETAGLLVFASIVNPLPGEPLETGDGGTGVTIVSFDPVTGVVATIVSHALSTSYLLSAFHYYHLPLLNYVTSAGPRVVCSRSRQYMDAGGFVAQTPADFTMVSYSPDGTELVLDIPGFFPAMYTLVDLPYGYGTYAQSATFGVGQATLGLHPSVCLYAEDVLAIMVVPDASDQTSLYPQRVALVDALTGQLLSMRELAFSGDRFNYSALTCPRLALWGLDGLDRVEVSPGSLLLTVSRVVTPAGPEVRGMYQSNDGGVTWVRTFEVTADTAYYLGAQFAPHPMDSLNPV